MTHRIDRRTFLAFGVGAVAWACGSGTEQAARSPSPDAGAAGDLSVAMTTPPNGAFGVGDRRIAFGLIRDNAPVTPEGVTVQIVPPAGAAPEEIAPDVIEIGIGQGGGSETKLSEIYVVRHELAEAGFWALRVEVPGEQRADAAFEVVNAEQTESPLVGDPAIAVPSPTTADPLGVDPICTRTPPCSMHAITVADALSSGQPSLITFATPRFCTSRTCGPVVDNIQDARDEAGEGVRFVHVEVWKDTENIGNPAFYVEAFQAYAPASEPLTLFVDADGIVRARWFGAVGSREVLEATQALAAGEL